MRKASKKKTALEEAAEEQAALEEIAKIRRNGFDPGDEMIKKLLLNLRPTRALVVMQVAAKADRAWFPYH